MGKIIACLGDSSDHGGVIISTPNDTLTVNDIPVAIAGSYHYCPIPGHGTQLIDPVTLTTFHNGQLILTTGAQVQSPCGATIIPSDRNVYVE